MAKITFQGKPETTSGELPKVGTKAPSFRLVSTDLTETSLETYAGKNKVLNIFPSVDTGVCAASVRHFNEAALSAFRSTFAKDYGLLLTDSVLAGLCSRVVIVLSKDNSVLYNEQVDDITHEPNYDAALRALT